MKFIVLNLVAAHVAAAERTTGLPACDVLNAFAASCQEVVLGSELLLDGDAASEGRAKKFKQKTVEAIVNQLTPLSQLFQKKK